MAASQNRAAWLKEAGKPLEVGDAPMPSAGPGEIVVKNAAVAINPLDCHQQDVGVFVQQWPAIIGCDIAGEVYEVGPGVDRFKQGDRVIGHCINLVTGRPSDGSYQLYTVVPVDKAAILPASISFTDGVVVPFALEAAVCALSVKEPGPCMPGVLTPALGLPYPSVKEAPSAGKTLVVYGASSSVGSMTAQIATAAGITVIGIAGAHNHDFAKQVGAVQVFDHKDPNLVDRVASAVKATGNELGGIFDAICSPETFAQDLQILEHLGGGNLALSHPPPSSDIPANIKVGMIFAVNDVANTTFRDFVTPALESGKLKCFPPPNVVGKGLEYVEEALKKSKAGVSATKLVVEL